LNCHILFMIYVFFIDYREYCPRDPPDEVRPSCPTRNNTDLYSCQNLIRQGCCWNDDNADNKFPKCYYKPGYNIHFLSVYYIIDIKTIVRNDTPSVYKKWPLRLTTLVHNIIKLTHICYMRPVHDTYIVQIDWAYTRHL
jgi:hypothetical protein